MAVGFPTKANWAAGDVLTAAQMDDLAGTVNLLSTVPPRNPVLNSNFSVWQRGTSFTATSSYPYTADRWIGYRATGNATVSRQTTSDTTNLPNIQYCARVQRNSTTTGTDVIQFTQLFESVNSIPFAGKTVNLSFYARAGANYSSASGVLSAKVATGTGTDQNPYVTYTGQVNSILTTVTLTTTWQRFTVAVNANLTATLAANTTELFTSFEYTPVGTAGAADYFEITGVQLELGSTASTYYSNGNTYQAELAACQRYYWRSQSDGNSGYETISPFCGMTQSATAVVMGLILPVNLRVNPSSVAYGNLRLVDGTNAYTISNITVDGSSSPSNPAISITITGGTQYRICALAGNNSTSAYIALSAEL